MTAAFTKTVRYGIAAGCAVLICIWSAREAPLLDLKQIQVTEGVYRCILHTGGKYGPTGPDIVDGVLYYNHFSYLFGIHAPLPCFTELNGHRVRMSYLRPSNSDKPLVLEVFDLQSRRIYGVTKEKHLSLYQENIDSKFSFYLSKLGLLLLALRMTCWNKLKSYVASVKNRTKIFAADR